MTNSNSNKMTYVQALNAVIARLDETEDNEILERLTALKDSLSKKRTNKKKDNAENDALRDIVLSVLRDAAEPMTITEIMKHDTRLIDFSNQKITSIVRSLVADGEVEGIKDKRKSTFAIVKTSDDEADVDVDTTETDVAVDTSDDDREPCTEE